ncbi:hypothetical protein K501DRAFT_211720 [Backusella circina FSU 941]|nr:hypothetical protein K501DRAFT_211720 [Backusella circina FSU 941]
MPSLADLEEASNRSKLTQDNATDSKAISVKNEKFDTISVKNEKPDTISVKIEQQEPKNINQNATVDSKANIQQTSPTSVQFDKPNGLSIDQLLDYINVSNKERKDGSQHVTPPYSPPSQGLDDFEKQRIKEKKMKKNYLKKKAKQATLEHKDRPTTAIDEMEFDSLLDSYTKVQEKKKRKQQPDHSKPTDIMDVASEILGRPIKKPMLKHPQKQRQHNTQNNSKQKKKNIKKEWIPEKVCVFWQGGHCKDGDKCTFKHEGKQNIKLCQFIQSQSCEKGIHCEFSHDLKSEPCRFYFVDSCTAEDDCSYYHGELTEDMKTKLHRMTGHCRFFHFKGYCNAGDMCPFSHKPITDQEELKKLEDSITPCKYFKAGKCSAGNECFYNH